MAATATVLAMTTGAGRAVRLDTTYRYDLLSRLETLTLGDAISNGGTWGDAVRFAGVHWGTDFGIRPDLVTTPRLSVSGAAVVPSTVDVLINGQRVSSQQLPPGPFTVDNLPALNGAGDVSLVVRDALGREQILTQPFYSGASLLAKGLSDYSIDLGSIRENYALDSNDYGALLATQTYRHGLSDALTLEEHSEYLAHGAYAGGVDAALRTGTAGILTLTVAEGGEDGSHGTLTGIGFQHSGERFNFNASTSYAEAGFHQVGDDVLTTERYKQRSLAQLGLNLQRAGSLSLAYVLQTYRAQPQQQAVSVTHNLNVNGVGAFSLTVSRATGYAGSTSAYLMFTRALGERRAVSMTAVGGSGDSVARNQLYATLIDNPPVGPGYGYQLTASTDGDYDALFRSQFTASDVEVEAARNSGSPGQRALLEGAFTFLDGQFSATRSVTGSFAVVDAGGIANLPVYVENQLVTHTDQDGRALLPDLRSFEANRIEVEPTELPLDTTIDTRSITVAPAYRSGVTVRFPVARVRGGTLRLVDAHGTPLPPGAQVLVQGKQFPVGLDGMTYVTGYDHGMSATASWPGGACRFRLPPPPSHDPLPDVGTLECSAGCDAMRTWHWLAVRLSPLVLLVASVPAQALVSCSVSAVGPAFGTYSPLAAAPLNANGSVNLTCTLLSGGAISVTPTVSLSAGTSGTYNSRRLYSGAHTLNYNIYWSTTYTQAWGDGTGGSASGTATLLLTPLTKTGTATGVMYGQIAAGQDVGAGTYLDTITVTVSY